MKRALRGDSFDNHLQSEPEIRSDFENNVNSHSFNLSGTNLFTCVDEVKRAITAGIYGYGSSRWSHPKPFGPYNDSVSPNEYMQRKIDYWISEIKANKLQIPEYEKNELKAKLWGISAMPNTSPSGFYLDKT